MGSVQQPIKSCNFKSMLSVVEGYTLLTNVIRLCTSVHQWERIEFEDVIASEAIRVMLVFVCLLWSE